MLKKLSKFIAFFLLLVFLQKSCLSLWMHDWLHTSTTKSQVPYGTDGFRAHYNSACNCLDEFTTPFVKADGQRCVFVSQPLTVYTLPSYTYLFSLQVCALSLTAPPSLA